MTEGLRLDDMDDGAESAIEMKCRPCNDDPAAYSYCLDHAGRILLDSGHVTVTPLSEIASQIQVKS